MYTPSAGFGGIDTFTYRATATPLLQFDLIPAETQITVDATLDTPFGARSDSDTGSFTGYALTVSCLAVVLHFMAANTPAACRTT